MSKLTRFLAIATIAVAPAATIAPSASAQTSPPYYQQNPTAIEAARNVRSDAVTAVKKLSAASLLRGKTKSIKLDTTNNGPGKYEIKITRKVGGKTITIASGTKTVKTTGRKTATLKLKVTTQGKAILKKLKASKIKLSIAASFTPKGQKKKTSKQAFNLKRK